MAVEAFVQHRAAGAEHHRAWLVGDLLFADLELPRHEGPRRYFWLLTYGAQLVYEPFGWRKEWYVDMVSFDRGRVEGKDLYKVVDEVVDIVVEANGPTYRLLDLDELADVVVAEGSACVVETLRQTQRFLDAFLHRGAPFPPPALVPYFALDHAYPTVSS